MSVYYNEIDPHAAQWLRNLIAADVLPAGDVDERSIEDITPNELRGYTQCHFFAGIGGWAYALDLAGWPRDRPVWTGSCPCQPFSAAGKGAGFEDERHLWPAWQHLIAQCRPAIVFGEQVASKRADAWIDLVHADMEGLGYAFGCVAFPAASIRAPHRRERAYWVADSGRGRCDARSTRNARAKGQAQQNWNDAIGCGGIAANSGHWDSGLWVRSSDGKARAVEPGSFPLAYGVPKRVVRLAAYGNAIVPQAAAEFICAYVETKQERMRDAA